jgi:hypothetical protein
MVGAAGTPNYDKLFAICKSISNSFRCAQTVEAVQMPKYLNRVRRVDQTLTLYNEAGKAITNFIDRDLNSPKAQGYALLTYLEPLQSWLIHEQYWEGSAYLLVNAATGHATKINDLPYFSPDLVRFVTASSTGGGYGVDELAVFRRTPTGLEKEWFQAFSGEEGPFAPRWKGSREIRFLICNLDGKCRRDRIVFKDGAWRR